MDTTTTSTGANRVNQYWYDPKGNIAAKVEGVYFTTFTCGGSNAAAHPFPARC